MQLFSVHVGSAMSVFFSAHLHGFSLHFSISLSVLWYVKLWFTVILINLPLINSPTVYYITVYYGVNTCQHQSCK